MLPFIGLGQALRARGHRVTLLGSLACAETARREGLEFVDLFDPEAQRDLSSSALSQGKQWGSLRTLRKHALRQMERVYRLIVQHYRRGETVVAAQAWLFGARIAQEMLGLPLATVHLQPLLFGSSVDATAVPAWMPRWVPRLLRWGISRATDRGLGRAIDAFRAELGLSSSCRPILKWWRSPDLVLGFFPEWFSPPQPDWPTQTRLVGFPLYHAPDESNANPNLDEFLMGDRPLLVFSQASLVQDARAYFTSSVEIAQSLGCRAVLLTSHREQVPEDLPPQVRHFDFVPLPHLLPHAAAIVHHGGMGTIGHALAAGVPQLTVPGMLDQFDNSRRLLRLGVSANLRGRAYGPRRAVPILRQLLDSPTVAERCRHYAAQCRLDKPFAAACLALERLYAESQKTFSREP
jgi:UDP:flavonoid glycosyltransferase YjiC (YdhE family)